MFVQKWTKKNYKNYYLYSILSEKNFIIFTVQKHLDGQTVRQEAQVRNQTQPGNTKRILQFQFDT